jgi:GntR family transcriptional repressor for pyruvate dehydrogenase complex
VLDVRRGDGTFVTSLEPQLLLEGIGFAVELMQQDRAVELLELRRILEPAATALAATRMGQAELDELETALLAMEGSHGETRIKQDIDFHARIARGSGNQTLATMLSELSGKTVHARIWHGTIEAHADERAHAEHEAIYAALRDRDPALAHSAALVHVAHTELWYRRMLGDPAPAAG